MRIAVLDDDASFTSLLTEALSAEGHSCHSFVVGRALLAKLHLETYDLLILDWNLPDTTGIDVVHWVKANLRTPPPILLVTSRSAEADIVGGLNAGADEYVVKPVPAAVLIACITALLRRAYEVEAAFDQLNVGVGAVHLEATVAALESRLRKARSGEQRLDVRPLRAEPDG